MHCLRDCDIAEGFSLFQELKKTLAKLASRGKILFMGSQTVLQVNLLVLSLLASGVIPFVETCNGDGWLFRAITHLVEDCKSALRDERFYFKGCYYNFTVAFPFRFHEIGYGRKLSWKSWLNWVRGPDQEL